MKLRSVICQWILVRSFGYAIGLFNKLDATHPDGERPSKREHLELLRGVCAALYRQIRIFGYPMMSTESPTEKRFTNQWP